MVPRNSDQALSSYQTDQESLIDEEHLRTPVYGSRRMTVYLNLDRSHQGLDDATPDETYFDQPLTQAA